MIGATAAAGVLTSAAWHLAAHASAADAAASRALPCLAAAVAAAGSSSTPLLGLRILRSSSAALTHPAPGDLVPSPTPHTSCSSSSSSTLLAWTSVWHGTLGTSQDGPVVSWHPDQQPQQHHYSPHNPRQRCSGSTMRSAAAPLASSHAPILPSLLLHNLRANNSPQPSPLWHQLPRTLHTQPPSATTPTGSDKQTSSTGAAAATVTAGTAAAAWERKAGREDEAQQHREQQQQQEQQQVNAAVTEDPLWTAPNALSLARAVSAPFIALLILQDNWPWAIGATAVSGLTDWADGALARRLGQSSVLGSYLDPLADKALIACVVGALAYKGLAPLWLAALVVGRDVGLVGGMALHRWRSLGWRVRGVTAAQFFDTTGASGVPMMRPLLVSKLNTVLQLALVSGCMTHAWLGLPSQELLGGLEVLTAGTTAASLGAYGWMYATGRMLAGGEQQQQGP